VTERDFLSAEDVEAAMAFRTDAESQASSVVGDPVRAREMVARFKSCGVDELILVMQAGTIPHEIVMESIKTFGEKVLPHCA
jgi:hypothetical protein